MRVVRHVAHAGPAERPRVVAAGEFDGLHRGHRRLLATLVEMAHGMRGDAVAVVVCDPGGQTRLTDRRQQLERLGETGVDLVAFAPGAEVDTAVARLGAAVLVDAAGGAARAPAGCSLAEVTPLEVCGTRVSAAAIRAALGGGDIASARAMLGRNPGVAGRVVHGFHRGASLGIPTANLRVRDVQLPPDGVYAVFARVAGAALLGVTNVGFNPTFGNRTRTVETFLLDFSGDLYGRRIEIDFAANIRGEEKFADVAALLAQIGDDIEAARRFFASHGR